MFDFVFVLCCKDTTKSNNYQIFKGKSYHIVYYLTFLNRKIKHYYLFTYYLLCYCYYILYVSYYIIYLIIYRERTKANGKGRAAPRRSAILPASSSSSSPPSGGEGREEQTSKQNRKRERTRAKDAADIFARSSPLFCSVCCPHRPHHRPREGRPPRPVLGEAIATTSPPPRHHLDTDRQANSRAAPRAVGHPARLVLVPVLFPSVRG